MNNQLSGLSIEMKPPVDPQEQIRLRAYEIYELRGREDGHELEDWLQAESEVFGQLAKAQPLRPRVSIV
jgi:hypothetical protein